MRSILIVGTLMLLFLSGCSVEENKSTKVSVTTQNEVVDYLMEDISIVKQIGLIRTKEDMEIAKLYSGQYFFLKLHLDSNKEYFESIRKVKMTKDPKPNGSVKQYLFLSLKNGEHKTLELFEEEGVLYSEDTGSYYSLPVQLVELVQSESEKVEEVDSQCIIYNRVPYFALACAGKEFDSVEIDLIGQIDGTAYFSKKDIDSSNYIFVHSKVPNKKENSLYHTLASVIRNDNN